MAASREWICVRLATYENREEGELLHSFFRGRGTLENTLTILLKPNGKETLSRGGRGPSWLLEGEERGPHASPSPDAASRLTALLQNKSEAYRHRPPARSLPLNLDFRRALNVAACDNQPLVVLVSRSKTALNQAEKRLAELAWSKPFLGRLQYVRVEDVEELESIPGLPKGDSIVVLQPDAFGLKGKVLASAPLQGSKNKLAQALSLGLERFASLEKDLRRHIAQGQRAGIEWTSEIPVTDPGASSPRRQGR
ncbi:MAG: hypothetical protein DWQ01_19725 [Planctomycetota bacterium]|nr:MAG: hypothetical protein DWQ01_19725 [Planctomycetota bacterium]